MALSFRRLGPYEIVAPLGAGGMGEVYRARDTRLHREVAVKVLPQGLVSHPERLRRFEREARAVSALNHPNIVVLYDVGREDDVDFIVMELIEGETLAARLARGALSLETLIRLGVQICSALEACHRKGMVHRDLKPGNIMLTASGVKLLDFGLARALETDRPSGSESESVSDSESVSIGASAAPTATSPLTQPGVIVGTLPYMAPEQLHGGPVDARCDVFALGAVLYEAATGRRAFTGDTNSAIVRAVLAADPPPPSTLVPECPRSLDRLLRLCLEKDPEDRYRSPHDVGLQLTAIAEEGTFAPPAAVPHPQAGRASWMALGLAVLFAGVLAYVSIESIGRTTAGYPRAVRFQVAPPPGGQFAYHVEGPLLAVSPDGSRLAFVATVGDSRPRIFVRALDELEPVPIDGTDEARSVFWSPDGVSIGFFTPDQLKRVDVSGSGPVAPVTIVTLERGAGNIGTWGPTAILFSSIQGEAIYRVSPDGGPVEVLLEPDASRGETRATWPWLLPDGRSFLYSLKTNDGQIRLELARPGEEPREVGLISSHAQFVEPGFLVYAKEGVLLGQRFDPDRGRLEGSPFPLAPAVRFFQSNGAALFATSPSGTLAYRSDADVMRLTWFDRSGRKLGTLGFPGEYLRLEFSADGKRLLFDRTRPDLGTWDVWSLDVERGIETRLTSSPDTEAMPLWLPGEKSIVYFAVHGGLPQLARRDLATEREEILVPRQGFQTPFDVSPDGRTLLFGERDSSGMRLLSLSLGPDGASGVAPFPVPISNPASARFSPDGRWIAFIANESGRYEAYVTASHGGGEKVQVSSEGASELHWGRSGRELLYLTFDRRLFSVPFTTEGGEIRLGNATLDFRVPNEAPWGTFDVTPDGDRILATVIESSGNERPATVIVNWPALLPP